MIFLLVFEMCWSPLLVYTLLIKYFVVIFFSFYSRQNIYKKTLCKFDYRCTISTGAKVQYTVWLSDSAVWPLHSTVLGSAENPRFQPLRGAGNIARHNGQGLLYRFNETWKRDKGKEVDLMEWREIEKKFW